MDSSLATLSAREPTSFRLETLPTDIWSCIAPFLFGDDFLRLKRTGSKSLWNRLRIPKVVKSLQLMLGNNSKPVLLKEFPSLEDLLFHCYDPVWDRTELVKLNEIPSTVRKLAFKSFDGGHFGAVYNLFVNSDGTPLFWDEHVPHLEVLILGPSAMPNLSWMARWPRNLTTLSCLRFGEVHPLPDSILHLDVRNHDISVMRLPPGLETLACRTYPHMGLFSPDYDFLLSPDQLNKPQGYFPSTLTKLDINGTIPISKWHSLPSTLRSLVFHSPSPNDLAGRSIIAPNDESIELTAVPLELLPKSLTSLHLKSRGVSMVESYRTVILLKSEGSAVFPPLLTTLIAPDCNLFPSAAAHLPSRLTRLSISNLCERICKQLPRGLLRLNAEHTLMSRDLINLLPRNLFKLNLYYAQPHELWLDYDTGKMIKVSSLAEYPKHQNFWQGKQSLPPTITSLKLRNFTGIIPSFVQNMGLSNLLKLYLTLAKKIDDRCIPHLNRHLTDLSLPYAYSISGGCFPMLPRGLTTLNLASSNTIADDDIQHLPRTLTKLSLKFALHLTDKCISDLPRQLVLIWMLKNKKITPKSAPHLPLPCRTYGMFVVQDWTCMRGKVQLTDS